MSEHYDTLETRDPALREREQLARLPETLANAMTAPGWAKQLAGVDPKSVTSRAALAKLPLLHKSDLLKRQQETPPFGGFNTRPPGRAKRLMMSPGPIFEPEGFGTDWWGCARACFAAGFRLGDVALNCFAYHLTPGGFIMGSGAMALGCAVVAAGRGGRPRLCPGRRGGAGQEAVWDQAGGGVGRDLRKAGRAEIAHRLELRD